MNIKKPAKEEKLAQVWQKVNVRDRGTKNYSRNSTMEVNKCLSFAPFPCIPTKNRTKKGGSGSCTAFINEKYHYMN